MIWKMKRQYFILFLFFSALFVSGCQSDFGQFNEQILDFANNDKRIDSNEYEILVKQIELSDEKGFQQFKSNNGQVDSSKVVSYLLRYFTAKKLSLTASDIWQPESQTQGNEKFNINVFLENSASMDGYVKGVTEFETAIYNLLGDFKISGLCDSLNLSYINKSIPYTKKNALALDIQDFIEKLEPSTFRQRGGDRSTSDLKNILNTALKNVDDNNAAVLISDFVFSPGNRNNAQYYLNAQSVGIKIDFAEKLDTFDLSIIVIQLQSGFDGIYYDKTDKQIPIKSNRPYYIWIIGSTTQIRQILENKFLDNIKGGYQKRVVLQSIKVVTQPNFKIQYKPKIGTFKATSIGQGIITGAKPSRENQNKGIFGFNVAVDFSNSLQDASYFIDTANYKLSNPNYQLNVESITHNNDPALVGFSHILKLQTSELREEVLKIDVVADKMPEWVYQSSSIDDSNILTDDSEKQKTFGLKYLIEGVYDAFYPQTQPNTTNSISITIQK